MELKGFTEYKILEALRHDNYEDSFLVYKFAKLIRTDFNKWDAYKYGIIDNQGNIINVPDTPNEKRVFGTIENIVRKVKRALVKFAGKGNMLTNLVSIFLLKEETTFNRHNVALKILDEMNNEEIEIVEKVLVTIKDKIGTL